MKGTFEFRPLRKGQWWRFDRFITRKQAIALDRSNSVFHSMTQQEDYSSPLVSGVDGFDPPAVFVPDDGEWSMAFVGIESDCRAPFGLYVRLGQENVAWMWANQRRCTFREDWHHVNWHHSLMAGEKRRGEWDHTFDGKTVNAKAGRAAMDACSYRFRCANGRGPEFRPTDPYIVAGLVRHADTHEIVRPPDNLACRCGEPYSPDTDLFL